ncbi:MAG: hypothetical protein J6W96_03800 [Alphaproteobacteria bacterium]|nr:hypothetical protein [Alphaproteobacteria bacterium]
MIRVIFVLALIFAGNVNAEEDRDCAKYKAADAWAQTEDGDVNTFSATFSGITSRQGFTNEDCPEPVTVRSRRGGSGGNSGDSGGSSGGGFGGAPGGSDSGGPSTHSGGSND